MPRGQRRRRERLGPCQGPIHSSLDSSSGQSLCLLDSAKHLRQRLRAEKVHQRIRSTEIQLGKPEFDRRRRASSIYACEPHVQDGLALPEDSRLIHHLRKTLKGFHAVEGFLQTGSDGGCSVTSEQECVVTIKVRQKGRGNLISAWVGER